MSDSPQRILAQKQMQIVRSEVTFCYICGQPLPEKGSGYKQNVIGEHIVPRSLLGDPPTSETERWAVVLDVHRRCEADDKKFTDNLLNLLQQMSTKPFDEWPKFGHLRSNLRLRPIEFQFSGGEKLPAFTNVQHVFAGSWTWVRGLHCALYLTPLADNVPHFVLPPVPACFITKPLSLGEIEKLSGSVRYLLDLADKHDKWDGIVAWGGKVVYRCVWHRIEPGHKISGWACYWTLTFPGTAEWSRSILGTGSERPWHGYYVLDEPPQGASRLSSDDFPQKPKTETP